MLHICGIQGSRTESGLGLGPVAGGMIVGTKDFVLKGDLVIVSQFVRDERGQATDLCGVLAAGSCNLA